MTELPADIDLDELREIIAAHRAKKVPPAPWPPEVTVDDLREIVDRRRAELAEAEDGQLWVDAVAAEHAGRVAPERAALERALVALGANPSDEARRAVEAATTDVGIRGQTADLADRAAKAHRRVTLEPARARVQFYEQLLADAPESGDIVGARERIVAFEDSLAG